MGAAISVRLLRAVSALISSPPVSPPALAAFSRRTLLRAPIVLNPFYFSLHPGDHTKKGPLRLLPIELTLLHDLPVAQDGDRMRKTIGPPNPSPQMFAYFPDDNAFNPEQTPPNSNDWWFWVKGHSKAEVVLRVPSTLREATKWVSKPSTPEPYLNKRAVQTRAVSRRGGSRRRDIGQ